VGPAGIDGPVPGRPLGASKRAPIGRQGPSELVERFLRTMHAPCTGVQRRLFALRGWPMGWGAPWARDPLLRRAGGLKTALRAQGAKHPRSNPTRPFESASRLAGHPLALASVSMLWFFALCSERGSGDLTPPCFRSRAGSCSVVGWRRHAFSFHLPCWRRPATRNIQRRNVTRNQKNER